MTPNARSLLFASLAVAAFAPGLASAQDAERADELNPTVVDSPVETAPPARAVHDSGGGYTFVEGRGRQRVVIGYRDIRRSPPEIWGTGLGLFLAGYVLDFAVLTPIANAISNDRDGGDEEDAWAWALIPVAGPIIQLGVGAPHPAIPIATGLMQIGGLVTFILGVLDEQTTSIPIYQGSEHDPSMLRIGLDAAQLDGGAALRVTLTHL
ncbi:MAG: hypothetical protein AB8I08_04735 [Sandaracinaceae bacterium]